MMPETYRVLLLLLYGLVYGQSWLGRVYGHSWSGWDQWNTPLMGERDDLLCDDYCRRNVKPRPGDTIVTQEDYDKCCVCRSSTTWHEDDSLVDLTIEYVTAEGGSVALPQDSGDTLTRIIHKNGSMTSLPGNICKISNLTLMDFSRNKILSLSGIECADHLDTVILEWNQIDHISNSSLAKLTLLRCLNLANNIIQKIDPATLSQPNFKALEINLSNNNMTSLDVTNVVSRHMYCEIDFSNNQIEELTNEVNFKLDLDQSYGPGFTSFENNNFATFPNFERLLQLDDLSQLGKFFGSGFNFLGVPLICDCNVENFLNVSRDIVETIWRDYFDVKCEGPEKYKGVRVIDVPLKDMVCSLGVDKGCPVECSCIDQPYHNTIKIECVKALLTSLPPKLPESDYSDKISLNLTGHNITEIPEELPYLERIETLDLSNNNLKGISEEVGARLENASSLIFDNNPDLKTLPHVFQYRNECSIRLAEQIIICGCRERWIEQWISAKGCKYNDGHREKNTTFLYITTMSPNGGGDIDMGNEINSDFDTSVAGFFTRITNSSTDSPNSDATANVTHTYDNENGTYSVNDINPRDASRSFYCRVPNVGLVNASDFKSEMLTCKTDPNNWVIIVTYTLVSFLTVLILVATFIYYFRYEILIMFIRGVLQKTTENVLTPSITYDAFVSFDEENPDLINWTEKVLIKNLEKDGYNLFIPYRHLEPGAVRDDATIEAMKKSRNTLLLMSESYLEPTEERPFTENEWKYGWNSFKSNRHTPIIVVNFDHITSDMVDDSRIKAYLRVGKVIDFTNHSRDIIPTIEVALGKRHKVLDDLAYCFFPNKTDATPKGHFQPEIMLNHNNMCHDKSNAGEHVSEDEEPVSYSDDDVSEIDLDNMATNRSIIQVKPIGWTQVMSNRYERPAELIIQDGDRQRHDNVNTFERGTQNSRRSYRPIRHQDAPRYNDNDQKTHWGKKRTTEFEAENRDRENTTLYSDLFKRLHKSD